MEHIYQKPCFGEDWFTYPQLYKEYANGLGDGSVFVEVGSWKGKSISFLAVELVNLKKTVACVFSNAVRIRQNDYLLLYLVLVIHSCNRA